MHKDKTTLTKQELEEKIKKIINNKSLRQFSPEVGECKRLAAKHNYTFYYAANGAFELKATEEGKTNE